MSLMEPTFVNFPLLAGHFHKEWGSFSSCSVMLTSSLLFVSSLVRDSSDGVGIFKEPFK